MLVAVKEFHSGVRSLHKGWQVWISCMMIFNFFIPLLYIEHIESKWTVGAFLGGMMIGMGLASSRVLQSCSA